MGVGKGDRVIIYMPMIPEGRLMPCWPAARILVRSLNRVLAGSLLMRWHATVRLQGSDPQGRHHADFCAARWQGYPLKANALKALGSCTLRFKCLVVASTAGCCVERHAEMWIIYATGPKEASGQLARQKRMNAEGPVCSSSTPPADRPAQGVVHLPRAAYLVYCCITTRCL